MAGSITTSMATSFKQELFKALHNFDVGGGSLFKLTLITSPPTGTYDSTSTNYSDITGNSDEVSSSGYVAGGASLANVAPTRSGTTAYTNFGNPSWSGVTFTAEGCMIYNSTIGGNCVGVFDFGGPQEVSNGTFVVLMPPPTASTAILRLQ
jgi:hypothetical protein